MSNPKSIADRYQDMLDQRLSIVESNSILNNVRLVLDKFKRGKLSPRETIKAIQEVVK